jgi:hypothetical protein
MFTSDLRGQSRLNSLFNNRTSHFQRHFSDSLDRREGSSLTDVLGRHGIRTSDGGQIEHSVGQCGDARDRGGQSDPRIDVHVIALRRSESPAVRESDWAEGTAGGHDGSSIGPSVGLEWSALRSFRGVGHGQDDRSLAIRRHFFDDFFGEEIGRGGQTQDHRGFELFDGL